MSIRTPKFAERRWKLRLSLHLFRWGFHVKARRGEVFRHLVFKASRGAAFGKRKGRRLIYIGWWQSRKGVKQNLNGWRFVFALDKLPDYPNESAQIPFFPLRPRDRDREFEIR